MIKHIDPARAAHYVQRPGSPGDRIPAILWISAAILALLAIRQGHWPSANQVGVMLAGVAVVVLAGSFAPRVVTWFLLAVLIAAALGAAPQIAALAAGAQQRIAAAAPTTGG